MAPAMVRVNLLPRAVIPAILGRGEGRQVPETAGAGMAAFGQGVVLARFAGLPPAGMRCPWDPPVAEFPGAVTTGSLVFARPRRHHGPGQENPP
jgi:hypothetical protein